MVRWAKDLYWKDFQKLLIEQYLPSFVKDKQVRYIYKHGSMPQKIKVVPLHDPKQKKASKGTSSLRHLPNS